MYRFKTKTTMRMKTKTKSTLIQILDTMKVMEIAVVDMVATMVVAMVATMATKRVDMERVIINTEMVIRAVMAVVMIEVMVVTKVIVVDRTIKIIQHQLVQATAIEAILDCIENLCLMRNRMVLVINEDTNAAMATMRATRLVLPLETIKRDMRQHL